MPELTAIHFGLLALMLFSGAVIAWILRSDRCAKEKMAVNASWQDQLESQQSEHNRLAEQNKSLMDQISQYQASQKDYSSRARELSDSLKEAFARRDELQRQVKDTRGKLEVAVLQRDKLRKEMAEGLSAAVKQKDDKIFRLSRELTSWQSRVPPLVERFRERDAEARELEEKLAKTETRLQALEDLVRSDNTRIEPLDADSLPDGGDASNEPIAMTGYSDASALQDQIDDRSPMQEVFDDDLATVADEDASLEDSTFAAVFSPTDGEDDVIVSAYTDRNPGETNAHAVELPVEIVSTDNNDDDDLQMIKGIGPSIEKTLHDLGIYRFHQIAEMSEYDIDRVAQQLRGFRSRIYREDWIGQARDLNYQKNRDNV